MRIGPYRLDNPVILAPMAGISDPPFRRLCRAYGAGLTVSEMCSSNPDLWGTKKSLARMGLAADVGIQSVQIAGSEPEVMAEAARYNEQLGAQIIDINMGCPAKKVNKKLAGSALLQYPDLVEAILHAVVGAVSVPVTLKIRTGWDPDHRNAVQIAQLAEQAGIQALAVHGRTRACLFKGEAEYDTIKAVKAAVRIPVIANGDITTPERARAVLDYTAADAIMIGRGAQGNPWLFQQVNHYLTHGDHLPPPSKPEVAQVVLQHIADIHEHYGAEAGARIARKHVSWYLEQHQPDDEFRRYFVTLEAADRQLQTLAEFFATVT